MAQLGLEKRNGTPGVHMADLFSKQEEESAAVPPLEHTLQSVAGVFTVSEDISLQFGEEETSITIAYSLVLNDFSIQDSASNPPKFRGTVAGAMQLEWPGTTPTLTLSFHLEPEVKISRHHAPTRGKFWVDPSFMQNWPDNLTISAEVSLIRRALVTGFVRVAPQGSHLSAAAIAARMDELIRYSMVDVMWWAIRECMGGSLQKSLVKLANEYRSARPALALFEGFLIERAFGGAE